MAIPCRTVLRPLTAAVPLAAPTWITLGERAYALLLRDAPAARGGRSAVARGRGQVCGCSDPASWHDAGCGASFPFEASFGTDDPRIHAANDTTAHVRWPPRQADQRPRCGQRARRAAAIESPDLPTVSHRSESTQ